MKTIVNITEKISHVKFGSFGAGCSFELEIDQAALQARPDDVLAQIRFAADLCRAAVSHELERTRKAVAEARDLIDDEHPRGYDLSDDRDDRDEPDRRPPPHRGDDRTSREPERGGRRGDRPRGESNGRQRERKNWRDGGKPKTGSQLWGFAKDFDSVKWFTALGDSWNCPEQFRDWTDEEVADAVHEFFLKRPDQREHAARNGRS